MERKAKASSTAARWVLCLGGSICWTIGRALQARQRSERQDRRLPLNRWLEHRAPADAHIKPFRALNQLLRAQPHRDFTAYHSRMNAPNGCATSWRDR